MTYLGTFALFYHSLLDVSYHNSMAVTYHGVLAVLFSLIHGSFAVCYDDSLIVSCVCL